MNNKPGKTLLIIDDSKVLRGQVVEFLKDTDLFERHLEADNGLEGLKLLLNNKADVVLCDLEMPGIDGLETCRRLRADKRTRYIPIIVMTGSGPLKMKANDAGADDCINKPFELTELALLTKSVLRIGHIADRAERLMTYMNELEKNRQK